MPEGANATTELRQEHAEIEQLAQRIAALGPGPERTGLVHETAARFLAHARAEERYLFPAVRRHLPQGTQDAVAEQRRVQAARRIVEAVERNDGRDRQQGEEYEALVGQFVIDIQRHIEQQDTVLLPQLLDACSREEINNIGRQMRYAIEDERGSAAG